MKYLAMILVIILALAGFNHFAKAATILFPIGGGTGKSTFTQGLLGANGTSPFFTSATTTVSCSGNTSCTSFTAIGGSPITITSTGGSGTGNVATSSAETSTYIPFWTSTAGTPATLSGGTSNFTWDGIKLFASQASTTKLSVSGNTYLATEGGAVAIGTTTQAVIGGHTGILALYGSNATAISLSDAVGRKDIRLNDGDLKFTNGAGTDQFVIANSGNVGIGTTSISRKLQVESAGADLFSVQRPGYDAFGLFQSVGTGVHFYNYTDARTDMYISGAGLVGIGVTDPLFQLDLAGNAVINGRNQLNLKVSSGTVFAGTTLQTQFNSYSASAPLIFNLNQGVTEVARFAGTTGYLGIGTTTPATALSVYTSGTWAGAFQGTTGGAVAIGSVTGVPSIQGAPNGSVNATANLALNPSGGNVGIGTTTPGSLLSVQGVANFTTGTTTFYGNGINIPANQCYAINGVCLGASSGITSIGPTGQLQTGSAITIASSTASFNGLTFGLQTVGSGNTLTNTPTVTGTLNNAGLTNSTISGVALGGTLGALSATNSSLTFSGSYTGAAAQTVGLNLANANTWTALQQFNSNASSTQLSVYGGTYLGGTATTTVTSAGRVGIGSSTPAAQLGINAIAGVPALMIGSSTTLAQIDTNGKLQVLDTGTSYNGVVSSLRQLIFAPATTTTWTGSTTGPYIKKVVIPYAATIRQVICETDTGTLGIDLYHTSTHLAYLNASTTKGTFKFTSNNTLTAGETLYMVAGTPASSPTSVTCSVGITETP